MDNIIEVNSLSKKWGYKQIFYKLDFSAKAGEIIAIMGDNGIGKTTFLRILSGITGFDMGKISIFGFDIKNDYANIKPLIGCVFHDPMFYEELTVGENLIFFCKLYGVKNRKQKIERITEKFGLFPYLDEKVSALSKGFLQRLVFCKIFLYQPKIILMDEPFNGIDKQGKKIIIDYLNNNLMSDSLCIYSTHDDNDTKFFSNRIFKIEQGKLFEYSK